jgi:hypothetical protein
MAGVKLLVSFYLFERSGLLFSFSSAFSCSLLCSGSEICTTLLLKSSLSFTHIDLSIEEFSLLMKIFLCALASYSSENYGVSNNLFTRVSN